MKHKTNKLPKQIYVSWEGDGEEAFLNATENTDGIDDGTQVGIYQLVAVKKQKVTQELV